MVLFLVIDDDFLLDYYILMILDYLRRNVLNYERIVALLFFLNLNLIFVSPIFFVVRLLC